MSTDNRPQLPIRWLKGEVKTPPFTDAGRREVGRLLRRLQNREMIGMPQSRPMPSVGGGVHELRVRDAGHNWRVVYRIDEDAILVVDVFAKRTQRTPKPVIDACRKRLADYDAG